MNNDNGISNVIDSGDENGQFATFIQRAEVNNSSHMLDSCGHFKIAKFIDCLQSRD